MPTFPLLVLFPPPWEEKVPLLRFDSGKKVRAKGLLLHLLHLRRMMLLMPLGMIKMRIHTSKSKKIPLLHLLHLVRMLKQQLPIRMLLKQLLQQIILKQLIKRIRMLRILRVLLF